MKKSLLALAVLGAFAGVASAQSSVTLFGIVDVAAQNANATGKGSTQKLVSGSNATSRLGFRGVEDIGGGLKAGFWLEGGMNVDNGTNTGFNFTRRSTVSLMGGFGEVRLGRDYTPTFLNVTQFDPFGTNGVGNAFNVARNVNTNNGAFLTAAAAAAGTAPTWVRADNSIAYLLPSDLGGLYGQVMIAAPEGVNTGKYQGARIGYGAGPINVAVAFSQQNASAPKFKTTNLGLSYDLGVAKLMFQYAQEKNGLGTALPTLNAKETRLLLGAVVPVGSGEFKASWTRSDQANSTNDAKQIALGYVHNLSKRTALYTHYSQLTNKGALSLSNTTVTPTAGGKAKGFEVGVRHSF
ncbi:outer membrane protein (porin) [Burkholderiales bacterium JOSHI_001]|nr:outer membrane protein (porin) [Burkholderiales bacterium JOSHI_001]